MPFGTALGSGSDGENISHFNAVRLRVVGNGVLRFTYYSLDDVESDVLAPLVMAPTTNIQPTVLSNFIQQRAMLEGKTIALDETFKINRIIVFARELFTSYPQ